MNIKAIVLTGLVGLTLLLTGCGGGGGGSTATQPTVIDGFNMTEGTTDGTTTYIAESITTIQNGINTAIDDVAANATEATDIKNLLDNESEFESLINSSSLNSTERGDALVLGRLYRNLKTSSNLYTRLNVPGVEQAHAAGWTGKGVTIGVYDNNFSNLSGHGFNVSLLAASVAPGATFNEYTSYDVTSAILQNDVITTSIDGATTARATSLEDSTDALVTIAAQHTNGPLEDKAQMASCDVNNRTVANCNTWAAAGLDGNNVIYVGEVDGSNNIPSWSNQAGDTYKNQFLVTASNALYNSVGDTDGNSYAAPRAAGAAALVRQKFPNLTGSQTATTILHTADDLGATGVDAVYGHGKLNVGKALSPVGNLH